jgi:hypothetical protein
MPEVFRSVAFWQEALLLTKGVKEPANRLQNPLKSSKLLQGPAFNAVAHCFRFETGRLISEDLLRPFSEREHSYSYRSTSPIQ